jgi:hypothetical protein
MLLAFDDAALARVLIATTGIAPAEREAWHSPNASSS